MDGVSVLILSRDLGLIRAVRRAARGARITSRSCLAEVGRVGGNTHLVIDPRVAGACCISRLSRWRARFASPGVVYLSLPAPPAVLLRLPQVCPGVIRSIRDLLSVLRKRTPPSLARSAWVHRSRILSLEGRSGNVRQFLVIALARCHAGCTVEEAAAALSLNVRRLNRLCKRMLGHPPGVILDLARVAAIARDLTNTTATLKALAHAYAYPDEPAMSNQFLRFVGIRPGAYRARSVRAALSRNSIPLS